MAAPVAIAAMMASTVVRSVTTCRGMVGSLARRSTRMNAIVLSTPTAISRMDSHEPQSKSLPAKETHNSREDVATASSAMPRKSILGAVSRVVSGRCSVRTIRIAARIDSGTGIRKHQRHPNASTISPPRSGPTDVATAITAPMYPAYRPRSRGGMIVPRMVWASAMRPPIPTPWITRATTSIVMDPARPAAAEPITKIAIAISSSFFLSKRSASLPHTGVVTALASRVPVTVQDRAVWSPPRSAMMTGSAVPMMVRVTMAMKNAARMPVNARRTSRCSWSLVRCARALPRVSWAAVTGCSPFRVRDHRASWGAGVRAAPRVPARRSRP